MSKKPELVALTQLRGLAAIMVFMAHISLFSSIGRSVPFEVFSSLGKIGVSIFFVLSGYILGYARSDAQFKGGKTYFSFLWTRLARLFPTHLMTMAISVPLVVFGSLSDRLSFFSIFTNGLLLHSWFYNSITFNGVSWCLSNELFFYIVFPFLPLLARSKKSLFVALILCVAAYVFGLSLHEQHPETVKFLPLFRLHEFVLGFLASQFPVCSRKTTVVATGIAALAWVVIPLLSIKNVLFFRSYVVYTPISALIIFGLGSLRTAQAKSAVGRSLLWLGKYSFAFYMLHHIVIRFIHGLCVVSGIEPSFNLSLGFSGVALLVTCLCAKWWTVFIELPCANFCNQRNLFSKRT